MINLFSALELGKNSLLAEQKIFQIIGHNIANVNTPGYSRQVVELENVPPSVVGIKDSGRGVDITQIFAVRSLFIDRQIIDRKQYEGKFQSLSAALQPIEALFDESQSLGLSDNLTDFFNKWADVADQPTDIPSRNSLVNSAQALADNVHNSYQRLVENQGVVNEKLKLDVDEINALAQEIARLNELIARAENSNNPANDLLDQRIQRIKEISQLVGVNVYYEPNSNSATVEVAGRPLVSFKTVNELSVQANPANFNFYDVYIEGSSTPINSEIKNGELEALLLTRDTYIPQYEKQLDNLAYGLIANVNALHQIGFALDGVTTGLDFFVAFAPPAPGDYTGAATALAVNPALLADGTLVAASATAGAEGNNENALQIAALMDADNVVDSDNDGAFDYGTYHEYLHSLFAQIGNDSRQAKYELQTSQSVLNYLQNQRDEVSGVSLDEEAAALMQFEKSYQAMAQFLTLVNRMLDVLLSIGATG